MICASPPAGRLATPTTLHPRTIDADSHSRGSHFTLPVAASVLHCLPSSPILLQPATSTQIILLLDQSVNPGQPMTIRQAFFSRPPKTVNVFDLTAKSKGNNSESSEIISTKEKAARITLCVVLTMVVLTAISLLLGEAFGLQWTLCSKPHNRTSQENWYRWPWNWKHNGPSLSMSESYQTRWNTLSLPEKRKELLRTTFGEVDLYDIYDISKDSHSVNSDEKV